MLNISFVSESEELESAPLFAGWRSYFGDPLSNLNSTELAAFKRGYQTFISPVGTDTSRASNASSCVECHNMPMPGGSGGSSPVALISIDLSQPLGSENEVVQSNHDLARMLATKGTRKTPPLFGLGLIENAKIGSEGRLGTHASKTTIDDFVSAAFAIELGKSTNGHCARSRTARTYPKSCAAEITEQTVRDVSTYLRYLAPPRPVLKNPNGAKLFAKIGCSICHTPVMQTIATASRPLAGVLFQPFSDLSLHDIGTGSKVRTAPLWGLSSFGPPYMSDGRSFNVQGAILRHHGEAEGAVSAFQSLSNAQQVELLSFLEGL